MIDKDAFSQAAVAAAMQNDPFSQAAVAMQNDPFIQTAVAAAMQNDSFSQMVKMLQTQEPAVLAFQEVANAFQPSWSDKSAVSKIAFKPSSETIAALSARLAYVIEPYSPIVTMMSDWERRLEVSMIGINTSWAASEHLGQSMIGIARLARLGDAIHTPTPYAKDISQFVESQLGSVIEPSYDASPVERDAIAIKAGLNPELIVFPRHSYNQIIRASGLGLDIPSIPSPVAIENVSEGLTFDPSHGRILTYIEQVLRQLIEKRLYSLCGEKWIKQRVPQQIRERWFQRQAEDKKSRRPVYEPIQYADFMDLSQIIIKADNWAEVFQEIFLEKDDFIISLKRLHPVRKAIAHSRPLGNADILILANESTRLLMALGDPAIN